MLVILCQLLFSTVLSPHLKEIRTIAEGRIAYLNQVLTYEKSPDALDSFFEVYLDPQVMTKHRLAGQKKELYAKICLTSHVYIQWYQELLDSLGSVNLETLYFSIEQVRNKYQVRYDTNGTDKKLENCNLREERYWDKIQALLQNNSNTDLFLWLNSKRTILSLKDRCEKHFDDFERLMQEIMSKFGSGFDKQERKEHQLVDEVIKLIQSGSSCLSRHEALKVYHVEGNSSVISKLSERYINVFREEKEARVQAVKAFGKRIAGFNSMLPFQKICEEDVKYYDLHKNILEIKNALSKILLQLNKEIKQSLQTKKYNDALIRKREREIKAQERLRDVEKQMHALREAEKLELQKESFKTMQKQQITDEKEAIRTEFLDEYEAMVEGFKEEIEVAYLQLPWQAYLTPEQQDGLSKKDLEVPVETQSFDFQRYSQDFFRASILYRSVKNVLDGQSIPQRTFLENLKSFGILITDTGSSEHKYDIWSVDGRCHRAFFHALHGRDLRITKEDWRFKNIVDVLVRAGYLDISR